MDAGAVAAMSGILPSTHDDATRVSSLRFHGLGEHASLRAQLGRRGLGRGGLLLLETT